MLTHEISDIEILKLVLEDYSNRWLKFQISGRSLKSLRYGTSNRWKKPQIYTVLCLKLWRKPPIYVVSCLKSVEGVTTRCNRPQIGGRSLKSVLEKGSNRCWKKPQNDGRRLKSMMEEASNLMQEV